MRNGIHNHLFPTKLGILLIGHKQAIGSKIGVLFNLCLHEGKHIIGKLQDGTREDFVFDDVHFTTYPSFGTFIADDAHLCPLKNLCGFLPNNSTAAPLSVSKLCPL